MAGVLTHCALHLPAKVLSNQGLHEEFPDWSVDKIGGKTGVTARHIADPDTYTSDLAVQAAEALFAQGVDRNEVDALLLCTQSPDYLLPTTACLVQDRLGLRTDIFALDYNLGCSGYPYGLGLASALVSAQQAKRVLLITSDTFSRYLARDDRSVRTIFGDGASASLICDESCAQGRGGRLGSFAYGTDGSGGANLLVTGAACCGKPMDERSQRDPASGPTLFMDGPGIFAFTLRTVPRLLNELWQRCGHGPEAVDRFIFHQANRYMLDHLRRKLGIEAERFIIEIGDVGNTISSTIPIALQRSLADGRISPGQRLCLVGFGVGYSWSACTVDWM